MWNLDEAGRGDGHRCAAGLAPRRAGPSRRTEHGYGDHVKRPDIVAAEMIHADEMLRSLAGETIDALAVKSLDAVDAAFLGLIVSKLSPMIGNLLEARIIRLLDRESEHGMRWIRQDPGFPDALLVDRYGESTDAGYEVKAWYALSTELTGRFRESQNLLAPRNVRVVIIAWAMSHIVYGVPQILDVLTVQGNQVAYSRDLHYHKPPGYLIAEPGDTTARTRNLQQTNVNGMKLQETNPGRIAEARLVVREHPGRNQPPHSPAAQALVRELMSRYSYRLDTNFAKIDRIDNPDIERFKRRVLDMSMRNRSIMSWTRLLKDLNSEAGAGVQSRAAKVIQDIYDEL